MNSPARTFTLIALIVLFLLLMHSLPTLVVRNTELRHVNILSALLPEPEEKDIDVLPTIHTQPLIAKKNTAQPTAFKEKWSKDVQPIDDYSAGEPGGMDFFYQQLEHVKSLERPVRIAYYGDSYIEGDILTGDLREMFQQEFGGNGAGWVDCGSAMQQNRISIRQRCGDISEFVTAKRPFNKSMQGISQRYFIPKEGAWAKTWGTRFYPHSSKWQVSTLFFSTPSTLTIQATTRRGHTQTQTFDASQAVQCFQLADSTSSISYTFSNISPGTCLYGMSLESSKGVVLDNFSMRGSPGITIENIPSQRLADFNRLRPYDLIILHYGLNIAVPGNPLSVIRNYTNRMKRVVQHLKTAFPQASILVVSVPDRNQRTADGIRTMKEVKQLTALQQQLAIDTGVGFFNFYEAMGGAESVAKLVEKGKANKDYIHINLKGGKELARKMFTSFREGLKNYEQRKALEKQ